MKYLFDSDAVTILYDDSRKTHHDALHHHVRQLKDDDCLHTSVIVVYELEYSFANAPDDKKVPIRDTIDSVLNDFDAILPVKLEAAALYGELKTLLKHARHLDRKAMRRHNIDIILASTAVETQSVLIGMDKIYQDIERLHKNFRFENWLMPDV